MSKITKYINGASHELFHEVSWPTWKELQNSALVVMVASLIIAALVFVMDFVFSGSMNFFYQTFA